MGSSAAGDEALEDPFDLDRRGFAAGLIAAGLFAPAVVHAQTPPPPPDLAAPAIEETPRLLANLLTRMATRTSLNGRGGYQFVLDTGAGRTSIAEDIAAALEMPPGPSVLVHGVTSAQITPTVRIARISFGGRRFQDVFAPVFPREMLAADGLLGLDVLSRFALELNLARRTVRLTPSGSDVVEVGRSFSIPSRLRRESGGASRARQGRFGQLILINTFADGLPVEAFVDTGAQYSIGNMALRRALAPATGRGAPRSLVRVHGVTGQTLLAEPGAVRQLEINRQRLGPTPLLFADLHAFGVLDLIDRPALLIGADILYRFRTVALDFGRSRMNFTGLRRPVAPPLTL